MQEMHLHQLTLHYPHLAAAFAYVPQAEEHLRRIQDLNVSWQGILRSGATRKYAEVVVSESTQELPATDTFDIIYAGGASIF
ncbi:hypothetical protein [Ktedonospora formicarum]|uniref:Uncharacterized protein n=1 Tax=Ktedonospora formicarum TaxID=2778364 RepID=A0A8J3HZD7_9CHLR|nr:hypothetical protein [Ktedonospora formicarum]GHO43793.1 hypothetical protein KSX_19560 [Ktedonospora formicarum]